MIESKWQKDNKVQNKDEKRNWDKKNEIWKKDKEDK